MVKFEERLDAKTKKRHKRQDKDALGTDDLAQMGWMEVDEDIQSIFEQLASGTEISSTAVAVPALRLSRYYFHTSHHLLVAWWLRPFLRRNRA